MAPYVRYVADHINRISGIHAGHPDRILDSKWRIASCLGLFKNLESDRQINYRASESS
jgi:hypothetical protein